MARVAIRKKTSELSNLNILLDYGDKLSAGLSTYEKNYSIYFSWTLIEKVSDHSKKSSRFFVSKN